MKPFFITTPIYYINATPHIGHAYTQFAADARARFERLRGREVYFLTGTDENAIKIARVAREQGRDVQEFCDELAQQFRDVWDALEISYDDYIRTTEPRHQIVAQRAIEKLWQNGHLEIGEYSGWYSVPDETFFRTEEVVEREGSTYIAAPSEDQSKAPLEWVEEKTHFFKLSRFADSLLEYYDAHPQTLHPGVRRNEALAYIKSGLRDTSISREMDWGIPVPISIPHAEGHVIYVWFEALMNYFSAPGYFSDDPAQREYFERIWPPDLQLMSKDIFTRFHATLWPALLNALGLPLPTELFAHGFWTVNGRKMSKRDPETIVEPVAFARQIAAAANAEFLIGVDALRYYSLREVTFGNDGDFSRVGCLARYNSDLANGLGNLVQRALSMLTQYFDGVVPGAEESLSDDFNLRAATTAVLPRVEAAYESLDFSRALETIWEIVTLANRVIEEQKPWAKIKSGLDSDRQAVAALLRELLAACQWCAVVLLPVMPHASRCLFDLLSLNFDPQWSTACEVSTLLTPGHCCRAPQALFPRIKNLEETITAMSLENSVPESHIEDNGIEEKINTANDAGGEQGSTPALPQSDLPVDLAQPRAATIEYDDFAKVGLRVGKVLEAARVPKADKLLCLQIDLGDEKRQILAGLAQQFEPESLVGKSVVVVANLAPRKLRGLESQGMILAASTPDGPPLGLVTIDSDVPAGSVVK
jgi:methionyl-tRNA synthetase